MSYKINPMAYTDIFAVPRAVVQDNLCLASATALRVLLLLLAQPLSMPTVEEMARQLKRDAAEIEDALIFWAERGLLVKEDAAPRPILSQPAAAPVVLPPQTPTTEEKKQVADLPMARPSHEQIAIRVNENEAFRELFREAQMKLGKTIGYDGQSLLIMLHDTYGLPVEVILMLLEYAKSKGKTGYKYIATLGRDWSEKEIDSLEGAEAYIASLAESDALWTEFRTQTGAKNQNPTAKQRRYLTAWSKELGFSTEMILLAYEISVDNTGKLSLEYMDKVLRSWHAQQIKTPTDAERARAAWNEKKRPAGKRQAAKQTAVFSDDASYDLEAYRRTAIGMGDDSPNVGE